MCKSKFPYRGIYCQINLILLLLFGVLGEIQANEESEEMIYIPVVFHIVHSGPTQDVSLDQIHSQLNALNQDFRLKNLDLENIDADFESAPSDARIEFVLANKIDGIPVEPVIRKSTSVLVFKDDDLFDSSLGGSDPVMRESILNVWVANLAEGLLGFYDQKGIAIDYKSFGTIETAEAPYDLGRTLTHEIGHFFSLSHLWGLGGCDSDDDVQDTPNQASALSGCAQSMSCGSLDMSQNFMNTSDDACLLFFTSGQVAKMRDYISSNLPSMIHSFNEVILSSATAVNGITIYPNPNDTGIFNIHLDDNSSVTFSVTSFNGAEIIGERHLEEKLDLSGMPRGIYFATFNQKNTKLIRKLIIK